MTQTYLYNLSSDGREAIRQTLRLMSDIVKSSRKDIALRETALDLTRYLKQKSFVDEVQALFNFVQKKIRYIRDIHTVETIHLPDKILEYGQGDCDDKSILLATLLETIGHPTRFVAAGFGGQPLSHVWVETKVGGKWLALDATDDHAMGWKPSGISSAMIIYN